MNLMSWVSRQALFVVGLGLYASVAVAANSYQVRNLVSDGGVAADHHDGNLVNGWGVAFNPNGFVWVADNGTGLSTLYDGLGNRNRWSSPYRAWEMRRVRPPGIVFNGSSDFVVRNSTAAGPARFIFASEDGRISGWAPNVDGTHALPAVFMADAVYKGLTVASSDGGNMFYAADFHGHKIDVFRSNYTPVKLPGAFVDPNVPSNYAPFNILLLAGRLYVAYAQKERWRRRGRGTPGSASWTYMTQAVSCYSVSRREARSMHRGAWRSRRQVLAILAINSSWAILATAQSTRTTSRRGNS